MLAAAVAAAVGLAGCTATGTAADSVATAETTGSESRTGNANTAEVVAAAEAFLDTLSEEQRESVLYDYDDEAKTTGWSNFPASMVERNGIALKDLTEEQREAALAVMEAALSEQGYEELLAIQAADGYLNENQGGTGEEGSEEEEDGTAPAEEDGRQGEPPSQPPGGDGQAPREGGGGQAPQDGGPGQLEFGEEEYYLSFFGEPDETESFMVQYGGHHVAYNITYSGDDVTLSPSLTGTEPMEFEYEGESYAPLEDKRDAALGAVAALDEERLAEAEIDSGTEDLLLGPGSDGPFPEEEGVLVSDLGQEQQDRVTAMLRAWVGDLDEEAADALIERYVSEYDETRLSWSGSIDADDVDTYIRLDGPSAWIEFSNQPGVETSEVHQHTMFRDQNADYGWEE
ncbi:DUF3500 domain-containing protein [Nocardiopsis sp. DSM 44743]|uniref:DUF3500 domain-containing protein n=1 Tax=Nocardiopsis lambiniae TaxID=3075539 RepID=A0ABU2MGE2_9ACTN|nr:DUF3500 domain-containing protein [Nocardiopsis sp. DSM 44743]MDT0330921.1 DUF3500 domain-containing protein [Nocardiopsis sp. DSM 44743]